MGSRAGLRSSNSKVRFRLVANFLFRGRQLESSQWSSKLRCIQVCVKIELKVCLSSIQAKARQQLYKRSRLLWRVHKLRLNAFNFLSSQSKEFTSASFLTCFDDQNYNSKFIRQKRMSSLWHLTVDCEHKRLIGRGRVNNLSVSLREAFPDPRARQSHRQHTIVLRI